MSVPLNEAGVGAAAPSISLPQEGSTPVAPAAATIPALSGGAWRPGVLFWVVGSLVLLAALIGLSSGFGGFLVTIAVAGLITGIVAFAAKRRTWLNIPPSTGMRGLVV